MKKGFTLIELLVYMAIMGFIIVVAGRVFSDSTSMRVRTQSMAASMEEINKITALLKEDLSQMGAKAYKDEDEELFEVIEDVYMIAAEIGGDSSSFVLEHRYDLEGGNDSIAFKKIAFNSAGEYVGIRLISWALAEDSTLLRRCVTLPGAPSGVDDPEIAVCPTGDDLNVDPIVMATDIAAFSLLPSKPGVDSREPSNSAVFDEEDFSLISNVTDGDCEGNVCGVEVDEVARKVIRGFQPNETEDEQVRHEIYVGDGGSASGPCREYPFRRGNTYFVTFKTPLRPFWPDSTIALFQPGVDHASIGFRERNNLSEKPIGLPNDFLFYMPQTKRDNDGNLIDTMSHYFEFSLPSSVSKDEEINACAVFTLAFYSPMAYNGALQIGDFRVGPKDDGGAYHFVRDGDTGYDEDYATESDPQSSISKKSVKAFELHLEIHKRGEIGTTRPEEGSSGFVIPTPNNGLRPTLRPPPQSS